MICDVLFSELAGGPGELPGRHGPGAAEVEDATHFASESDGQDLYLTLSAGKRNTPLPLHVHEQILLSNNTGFHQLDEYHPINIVSIKSLSIRNFEPQKKYSYNTYERVPTNHLTAS